MAQPKSVAGIILLFIIIVGDIVTGAVSSHAPGGSSGIGVPLGTWTNMPSSPTELMGNTSYRGILLPPASVAIAGISAGISVSCISTSNTLGANLQLQYALFSVTTNTNTSNFQSIPNGIVYIDGVSSPGCVNNSYAGNVGLNLNSTVSGIGYIFRVMGSSGGGPGDNPRFSSVTVELQETIVRIYMPAVIANSITVNGFTGRMYSDVNVVSSVTPIFQYVATNNGVQTDSGSSSCTISIGSNNCSVAVTFPLAFATVPNVVMTSGSPGGSNTIPLGTISLLSAQTLTV